MPGSFIKYVGDTFKTYDILAIDADGNSIDLTEASLSLKLDAISMGSTLLGTGTWNITDPTSGVASYTWSENDLSTPGLYLLYTVITINSLLQTLPPVLLLIVAAP